jgi:hypothetical protein
MMRSARDRIALALTVSVVLAMGCGNNPPAGTSSGTTGAATTSGTTGGTTASSTSTGGGTGTTGTGGSTSAGSTTGMPDAGCSCDAGTFCDPLGSGRCVNCRADHDCSAPAPICQTLPSYLNYGKCVVCCEAEPTCPVAGQVCDISLGPTYQQCVPDCRDDAGIPPCPLYLGFEAQHCSQATGTCSRGCALDVDCAPGGYRCAVDSGLCVQCLSPQDCPYSMAGCYALTDTCGACTGQADCPAGLTCGPTGNCLCTTSTQCGGNAPVCVLSPAFGGQDAGFCGCVTNADCAAQEALCVQVSFSASGACIPPCSDGGIDCRTFPFPDQFCDMGTALCGPCMGDNQCIGYDAGPRCLSGGYCGCNASTDCGPSGACSPFFSACVPACTLDAGSICASHQVCDPQSRLCVGCLTDAQCVRDGGSQNPYCLTDIDAGMDCVQCLTPTQCPTGTPGCNSAFYICGSCNATADCPASAPICRFGACVPSCNTDTDCKMNGEPYCLKDIDAGNTCVACLSPNECPASAPGCDSLFFACGFCTLSSDCPASVPVCQGTLCGASCVLPDGGEFCAFGQVCQASTGMCVNCLQDADCSDGGGPTPYCRTDVDAGPYCAQCVNAGQCGAMGPCNSQTFSCGSCAVNADCPTQAPHCSGAPFGACTDAG